MKNSLGKKVLVALLAVVMSSSTALAVAKAAGKGIDKDTRCAVCGMFVSKYQNWVASSTLSDGKTEYFDGVKDMMAFFFAPQKYGAKPGSTVIDMSVNDYYTLTPIDAKKAFYVIGSDISGPMGPEFIPFATKAAADSFRQDHHGKEVLTFQAITPEMVESMRSGQRMK
jgi:copper chaperone NosL